MPKPTSNRKPPASLDGKSLLILCQAVQKQFPWDKGHGKTQEAWQAVCDDFKEAQNGKNSITVQTAKKRMENLLNEWEKLNKEDRYSGVLFNEIPLQKYVEEIAARKREVEVSAIIFRHDR
jgi:hypothetical protein